MLHADFEITYTSNLISAVSVKIYWQASIDYGTATSYFANFSYDIQAVESTATGNSMAGPGTPGYSVGNFTVVGSEQLSSGNFNGVLVEKPVFTFKISDRNGDCLTYNANGIWSSRAEYVEFGVNKLYSCKYSATSGGDFAANCGNKNILKQAQLMNMWAQYGQASVNNQLDWIKATAASEPTITSSTTTCSIYVPEIRVYYQMIGKIENRRYQIRSVEIKYTAKYIFLQ